MENMKQIAICLTLLLVVTPMSTFFALDTVSFTGVSGEVNPCAAACTLASSAGTSDGETWSIELVDSIGKTGQHTDIAIRPDGTVYISYYDFLQEDLRCAYKSDDEWEVDTVDAEGAVGTYTSIDVDNDGRPAISYYDETEHDLKYAVLENSAWRVEAVDTEGDVGRYSSLAVDGRGDPHIVYYDGSTDSLKYATRSGGDWNIAVVDAESDSGRYAAIALDSQGTPHCTYGRDETVLMYASRATGSWETRQVDSEIKLYGSTAIAMEDDTPHIAYFDISNDPNWRLRYATSINGDWTIEIVDPDIYGFWRERGLDIAVRDGVVHLGYFHWDDWDTGYAYRYHGMWTTEIVESEGDIGAFASIALDSQGYPHMSYMDRSNLALKYAYKTQYAPVAPEKPEGPGRGRTGAEHAYTTSSADLDGDEIQYGWDWDGDRNVDEWTPFIASGDGIETTHTWDSDGTYTIRVKTRDDTGLESEWSAPLQVSMPYIRQGLPAMMWQWLTQHLPILALIPSISSGI